VRTTPYPVLYKIDVCLKLFNLAFPKFDEQGGTNREAHLPFTYLHKNEEDVSHGNTRNLFCLSVGATSSMQIM
jgi:hypothetical protein